MRIENGNSVLDVGCGAGADTLPMGKIVEKAGEVVGVDYDEESVNNERLTDYWKCQEKGRKLRRRACGNMRKCKRVRMIQATTVILKEMVSKPYFR